MFVAAKTLLDFKSSSIWSHWRQTKNLYSTYFSLKIPLLYNCCLGKFYFPVVNLMNM